MKRGKSTAAFILMFIIILVECNITVFADNIIKLPESLKIIDEEAFCGDTSIGKVVLPDTVTEIRSRAFADSTLSEINLPDSLTFIADDAFDGTDVEYNYTEKAHNNDFEEEGRRMAFWNVEYLKTIGRNNERIYYGIMEGTNGTEAQIGRTKGYYEAFEQYPNMMIVTQQPADFTTAGGRAVMKSWLKYVEKIDVILCQSDNMALGAIEAIKDAGLVPGKDIIVVGCGATKRAIEAIVVGDMNATVERIPLYKNNETHEDSETVEETIFNSSGHVFDCVGGIEINTKKPVVSIKAAYVIDSCVY